jgi:hypothetical protein
MIKAPSFFLTAIGTSRVIGGPPGPTALLLLIFHGHAGAETAYALNMVVRNEFPSSEQLLIASVIDLRHIPRYMRSAVELTLASIYRQAAQSVPEHLDPTEYVILAPDWEGKVTNAFSMQERINDIGLVLITNPWTIFDHYTGTDPSTAVLRMVTAASDAASNWAINSPSLI